MSYSPKQPEPPTAIEWALMFCLILLLATLAMTQFGCATFQNPDGTINEEAVMYWLNLTIDTYEAIASHEAPDDGRQELRWEIIVNTVERLLQQGAEMGDLLERVEALK